MNIRELLKELDNKNVKLTFDENGLDITAPIGAITPELKECLSKYKNQIINLLHDEDKEQIPLNKIQRDGPMPLSYAQQRLWFINQFEGGQDAQYNIPWSFRLTGKLDIKALKSAFNTIIQRHESLRTTFHEIDDKPVQIITDELQLNIPIIDVTEEEVQAHTDKHATKVFGLTQGPLIRVCLLRLSSEEHVLLINIHHIISDGWSMGVLSHELLVLYEAYIKGEDSPLPPLPIQYADFAYWQRQWLQGEILDKQINYWKKLLQDAPALLELPTNRPRPAKQRFQGATERFDISNALTKQLNTLSRQENSTLFMVLIAAFQILLYRYSRQTDICVGTPLANRQLKEMEGLIGFFVNMLVIRNQLNGKISFRDLLKQVNTTALSAYDHQDIPFEHLVEALKPERSLSYTPIFQVVFVLQNAAEISLELPNLKLSPIESNTHTTRFDLAMDLTETPEGILGKLEYNTDLFDQSTIEQMVNHYQILLESIADNIDESLATLPMLNESERQQLLFEWNDTKIIYSKDQYIHKLFENQAENTPNAIAVVYEDQQLTYEALNKRSNQLAHYLIEQGVGPDTRIGLCLERSLEMIVSILGILKAGGAYVPIDADYPKQRIEYMLADSNVDLILTQSDFSYTFFLKKEPIYFYLDQELDTVAERSSKNPIISLIPTNLAYMIYTSGSTGLPKATMINHSSLTNHMMWMQRVFEFRSNDIILHKTPLSFDASIWEWSLPLLIGAQLLLAKAGGHREPDYLLDLIDKRKATVLQVVPSLLSMLLSAPENAKMQSLRYLFCGGEPLSINICNTFKEQGLTATLYNLYGPTEATIDSTFWVLNSVQPLTTIPIGRPIDNAQIYILDNQLNLVPAGALGELYIGGIGLARGYLNRADLTSDSFIPDPFGHYPGARLYKTGDLAHIRNDANIEYIGRTDHQVKIRGLRIELGEIENVLAQQPGVSEAVVLAHTHERQEEDHYLAAYIVCDSEMEFDQAMLQSELREILPDYMIPLFFILLEKLPLTSNGKIDRKALPIPDADALQTNEYVAPSTEIELKLVIIWAEVLDIPAKKIGIQDNFFNLGGHSLLATRVVSQIRNIFNIEIQIRNLFTSNTIKLLSSIVNEEIRNQSLSDNNALSIAPIKRTAPLLLSFAQQRLWFINQFEDGTDTSYNMPWAYRLVGELNVAALQNAFHTIIQRHESLRTTFNSVNGEAVQLINDELQLDIPIVDIKETDASSYISAFSIHVFDLSQGPLIKLCILRLSDNEHVLLINMHHIISDGWSMGIFSRELSTVYTAYINGESSPLPKLPIQYADFAHWQRQWLQGEVMEQQVNYWKKQLEDAPALLELPTDSPRPTVQSYRGSHLSFTLSTELNKKLQKLSRTEGVTMYMILLAAFNVLLARYSAQTDICVGSPIANRRHQEIEGLIGFFVNTLVLRIKLENDATLLETLQHVKNTVLSAYAHQDVPFEHLVEILNPDRNLSHTPLFQVMFILQNLANEKLTLSNISITPIEIDIQTAKFDLTMFLMESEEMILGNVEYNTDLFNQSTIKRMISHYKILLEEIVKNPEERIYKLPLLTESEYRQVTIDSNYIKAPYPNDKCIHHLFESQTTKTPDAIAIISEEKQLTYQEVNKQSNQLAYYLIEQGVKPDNRIGLCVERSLEMVIGLLGILKAGGAYVPLDPEYPKERLTYMLENAHANIILTKSTFLDRLSFKYNMIICLDKYDEWQDIKATDENPISHTQAKDLAYVIYTSGSTGRPKAVAMPHQALSNLIEWQLANSTCTEGSRTLQFSSISFDVSFQELFSTWCSGGTLILISEELCKDPFSIWRLICNAQINRLFMPFIALQQLTEIYSNTDNKIIPNSLQEIITAGEQLQITPSIRKLFQDISSCKLYNQYGPSESHVVTALALDGPPESWEALPTIGKPIANNVIYILDKNLHPVPLGILGEIYIGGVGLARGYLGRDDLTQERFVTNPFGNGRLYKTGDLARHRPDRSIEFKGRTDNQIKIRGYRIEPGEIENVLTEQPSVREAIVMPYVRSQESKDKYLVAYIVPRTVNKHNQKHLRKALLTVLPDYMVPAVFIFLEALPLTPSGKINRRALPEPDVDSLMIQEYVAPRTDLEQGLVSIWSQVLNLPSSRIGIDNNFFNLGGHSLLATRVISHIRKVFNTEIQIRDLFSSKTVRALAIVVNEMMIDQSLTNSNTLPLKPIEHTGPLPLSFAQQRLWFLNQFEGGTDISYNMHWAYRLAGELNLIALQNALQTIIQRHESLRTTFKTVDGEAAQIISNQPKLDMPVIDVAETDISSYFSTHANHVFDLSQGPLIKLCLLRLSNEKYVLLINMHHIISDGWSLGVFNQELTALYTAYVNGEDSPLPSLPIQYVDFAHWQRQWLQGEVLNQQVNYWKAQLKDAPALLELPTDRPRPALQRYQGLYLPFILPVALIQRLEQLSRAEGATLYMILLTAFNILLARYSGQTDICIGSPIANRRREEVEKLIGFFVNTLVLRTRIEGNVSFRELLQQVKATAISAYSHQDVPFEHLVDKLQPERSMSYQPLFQVLLALLNTPQKDLELPNLSISLEDSDNRTAKFDLSLYFTESPEGMSAGVEYDTDLFDQTTIERLIIHYQILLEGIVDNPNQNVATLPMLSEHEQRQLVVEWNDTGSAYPQNQCIHHLFEAQVEKTPEAIAAVYEGQHLSYLTLNQLSNQLAHYLIEQGVGTEIRVGLCLERSLEMVIGILSILKAGGAYVPIDPKYPQKWIEYLLSDSGVSLLLTQTHLSHTAFKKQNSFCLDRDWDTVTDFSTENPIVSVSSTNLSYVIYTSGSTGKPKGVMVNHKNVINTLYFLESHYPVKSNDAYLLKTNYVFDVSLSELFSWFIGCGHLVILPPQAEKSPGMIINYITDHHITHINFVPSMLKVFLEEIQHNQLVTKNYPMKYLLIAGEAFPKSLVKEAIELFETTAIENIYGPTESSIYSAWLSCSTTNISGSNTPIGKPISNTTLYNLDSSLQPVPVGVPGELCIAGAGLARGYLNRASLTADRFIPNSFSDQPGTFLYKTSDLVRYQSNGNIEFLGRTDHQVKVRGFRIELGDIETNLLEHPAIKECIVLAREDEPGNKRLVAYLVPDQDYVLPDTEIAELNTEAVALWQDVFDNTHASIMTVDDPFQDFTGWISSYTGEAISKEDMRAWADTTVDRILELNPQHVLEIGCGTGLLLGRLVPNCESYVGMDFSSQVLNKLETKLPRLGHHAEKIKLLTGTADNLDELAGQTFDTIILNSVVQYFPDIDYLVFVLTEAQKLLAPGGQIFIGDVRNLCLLETFHTSVQLHKTRGNLQSIADIRNIAQSHTTNDNELIIAPSFFQAYKIQSPTITHVQTFPKLGDYQNELSKYRYDVVLHTSETLSLVENIRYTPWKNEQFTAKDIQNHLSQSQPDTFGITSIPNARLHMDIQIQILCASDKEDIKTIDELKTQLDSGHKEGMTPYALKQLAESVSYTAEFSWASGDPTGAFDVVFCKRRDDQQVPPLNIFPHHNAFLKNTPFKAFANNSRLQDLKRVLLPTLRDYLLERAPEYMVPAFFVFIDALPLTPNGKINRKALPVPDVVALQTQEYVAPATDIEQQLVTIWAEVLGIEASQLGTHTNFFEMGGDSIISLQIIAHAKRLGLHFTPKQLFANQTISDLAMVVKKVAGIEAEQGQVTGEFPFIPIQHWFFEQELEDIYHFNQAFLLSVSTELNEEILSTVLEALMVHHDALRLRFEKRNTDWYQCLREWDTEVAICYIDLSSFPPEIQRPTLEQESSKIQAQLNIQQGPLLYVGWFHMGKGQPDRLLIAIHHLAVDGVSWRILLEDFESAYHQLEIGQAIQFPAKTTSYKSWSEHLQDYTQSETLYAEMDYWGQLGRHKLFPLPQDRPCQSNENSVSSARISIVNLDRESTQALLQEVPSAYNTQINDVLLTALLLAFHQWTGENKLFFDLEGHGREDLFEDVDLSRTVGWFTTIYPVYLSLTSTSNLGVTIKSIKEQLRQIPKRGIGYGLLRYCNKIPSIIEALRCLPSAQLRFNYLGQFDQVTDKDSLFQFAKESSGEFRSSRQTRTHLIDINSLVINEHLQLHIEYSTAAHDGKTINTFGKYIIEALQNLIDHCLSSDAFGYTPSDFPDADLESDELDAMIESLEMSHE